MDYVVKKEDGRYYCVICEQEGKSTSYAVPNTVFRHRKAQHGIKAHRGPTNAPKKVTVVSRSEEVTLLKKQLEEKDKTLNQVIQALETVNELKNKMDNIQPTQNITQNINNTINIYFNKDLKYYPELVKLIGRKNTCDYLLFKMPESRDLFGVLDKLFVRDVLAPAQSELGMTTNLLSLEESQNIYVIPQESL